jgi:hypothetical protein
VVGVFIAAVRGAGAHWTAQGGQFVAVGHLDTGTNPLDLILTSPDGVVWTSRDSSTEDPLHAVTYGAGRYVAVGHLSFVASADGIAWTRIPVSNYAPTYGVAYGNGRFLTLRMTFTLRATRPASRRMRIIGAAPRRIWKELPGA